MKTKAAAGQEGRAYGEDEGRVENGGRHALDQRRQGEPTDLNIVIPDNDVSFEVKRQIRRAHSKLSYCRMWLTYMGIRFSAKDYRLSGEMARDG